MRQAGTITSSQQDADRFANYLLSLGISSKVEAAGGQWAIWIHDENQLPRSKEELDRFRLHPQDELYRDAEQAARQVRREEAEKKRLAQKNFVDMRNEWASPWRRRPVTMTMIVASVLLFLDIFGLPKDELMFSLPEIESGQIWRLVTPIFLHAGPMHLLFNMWWLYDLGSLIERHLRWPRYSLLVLIVALASNYGQFEAVGANFVGMSGVVYGLFGYAWVRGRLDPTSGLYLRPDVAFWMMAWFVLCIVSPALHVANWAHGVGLITGGVLGFVSQIGKQIG